MEENAMRIGAVLDNLASGQAPESVDGDAQPSGVRSPRERVQATRVASALDLLEGSAASLVEAGRAPQITARYAVAHLAALRAAAAVLAVRGLRIAGTHHSGGPRNLWELLPAVAPELHEWAD
ncbi:MAG: SAV_6107 family HEPN domain-containing protein, partial [Nostocoides sp.]